MLVTIKSNKLTEVSGAHKHFESKQATTNTENKKVVALPFLAYYICFLLCTPNYTLSKIRHTAKVTALAYLLRNK